MSEGTIQERKILLVEGPNDLHVIKHICDKSLPMADFHIENKDGLDNLLNAIGPEIKAPGREVVGLVVDVNGSFDTRWSDVSRKLQSAGIDVPNKPASAGTFIEANEKSPKVGIWLMPNNRSPGELEDFVQEMIHPDDPVWPKSESYIDSIPLDDRKFAERKEMKAKIHAWLAAQEHPGLMGPAIRSGQLRCDDLLCSSFISWIGRLFGNRSE